MAGVVLERRQEPSSVPKSLAAIAFMHGVSLFLIISPWNGWARAIADFIVCMLSRIRGGLDTVKQTYPKQGIS